MSDHVCELNDKLINQSEELDVFKKSAKVLATGVTALQVHLAYTNSIKLPYEGYFEGVYSWFSRVT